MPTATFLSIRARISLAALFICSVLLLICGAFMIPFAYESSTMFYKFGLDKTLLRIGKILAGVAVVLVLVQIMLVARFKIMDRVYPLDRLYALHRVNGIMLCLIAILHPLLVIAAEDFSLFPLEVRYWPEFVGVGALVLLIVLVITAQWRRELKWAYQKWLRLHRWGAPIFMALIVIHILFVSETYTSGPPRWIAVGLAGLWMLLLLKLRVTGWSQRKNGYRVQSIEQVGADAISLTVSMDNQHRLTYLPGQFAFITPLSAKVPKEPHPFTICSTPSRPDFLQFVIRMSGDWTVTLKDLEIGDRILVDGPYGRFSHLALPDDSAVVMIAGGIGITPMLSMLRYMADTNDLRRVLLIWSNRGPETVVLAEEIESLQQKLQQLEIVNIITRAPQGGRYPGRLNRQRLARLLHEWPHQTPIFICAPSKMVQDLSQELQQLGFSPTRLYKEAFQL